MGAYLVENYLKKLDWRVYENSNTTYSLQGLNFYISSEVTKEYWLTSVYNEKIANAHKEGDIHIHDLQNLSVYCVGWDLYDLLTTGFKGAYGKAESNPPKHFSSALGQIVNFLYTLQGEAAGAQAFSNFDTLLAPFVRYDGLSFKQVKQAIQEFVFNLNVPTRVGFQTPFTNLTFDLKAENSPYADQYVVVGGQIQKEKYRDFQKEMDMINEAFFEVMSEGDASGRIFTFPIPTYNITEDFDWDNPVLEKLWKMTGKYGIPYFANFINSDLDPNDARSMCCRLRLDVRELKKRGGGLFGANPLTGSIGVVTINLPRIGYLSNSKSQFFERLNELLEIAKESLEIKRRFLEDLTDKGLYPYSKFYLRSIKGQTGEYWKNHFSTVGVIGMNEAALNLLGVDIATEEGKKFAEEVLDFINSKLIKFQMETGNNYNLEATPAEGTSYRLAKIDKSKYPDIIVANEKEYRYGAAPYYTNSTHLPVDYSDDPIFVLENQDSLQTKYTGGTVIHFFLGEKVSDTEAVKGFIRYVCENYHLPYFTLTPTFSVCPVHGYISGEHRECPECGEETEVYSRIVGYFRPVKHWNDGKKEEFKNRKMYKIAAAAT
ncbi:ribonucleoside-triphosphate reductase class III catalytic subunit [Persephonella hydrogeniphila]|uniref:Ribonucleoside-triphosphate reductase class III catalytic subunit n=1 Tax=Persephonella hydrogeniphila TaxID=198703 RepID=A0A285NCX5_9AQUI|nr:ribonucleoside triphosphate reductase [Persephonella hydrogeniphila]SNZ07148.1 ribonucleoside-triphosphate reductase class III catalytic subunit [Persephonella hydrogeniphila]